MTIKNLISSTTRKMVASLPFYSKFELTVLDHCCEFTLSGDQYNESSERVVYNHRLCVTHSEDRHEIFLVQIFTDTEFFRTIILIYVNLRYFMQILENQIYINLFWIVGGGQRFVFKYHVTIIFYKWIPVYSACIVQFYKQYCEVRRFSVKLLSNL